jgi:hypothetical protein
LVRPAIGQGAYEAGSQGKNKKDGEEVRLTFKDTGGRLEPSPSGTKRVVPDFMVVVKKTVAGPNVTRAHLATNGAIQKQQEK